MLTKDIHGKTLSNSFESAITDVSQYIKPMAVANLQDARHLTNLVAKSLDESDNYVYFNALGYSSTPDSSTFDLNGDVEIVARLSFVDWTPSGIGSILSKWSTVSNQRSYRFAVTTTGNFRFSYSPNGTTAVDITSTAVPPFVNEETYWVKVTFDANNGAGGRTTNFYWAYDSNSEPSVWTQLGSTVTTAVVASIYNSTSSLIVGAETAGGTNRLVGNVRRVILRNGIDGDVISDFNPNNALASTDTSWYSSSLTGELWTLFGGTTLNIKNFIRPEQVEHDAAVVMSASVPTYCRTSNRTAFNITNDIEIVARVSANDWTPATDRTIVSKRSASTLSYHLYIKGDGTGRLYLQTSPNGTSVVTMSSTSGPPFTDGQPYWVKVTLDTSKQFYWRGILRTGWYAEFFYSTDQHEEPNNWIFMNSYFDTTTTSIYNSTQQIEIGGYNFGIDPFDGKIYRVIIRDGIGGSEIVDFNPSEAPSSAVDYWISSSPNKEGWRISNGVTFSFGRALFANSDYYFNVNDLFNGIEYETFAWGVAGAIDSKGHQINASGKYVALPSTLDENLKYGWIGCDQSDSNKVVSNDCNAIIAKFDSTTFNKVKIVTTELFGAVESFVLKVYSASLGLVHNQEYTFNILEGEFEKNVYLNQTYSDINQIVVIVLTTFYANDYPRLVSISPIYEVDISNHIVSLNSSRIRDLHETSLPISGTSQTTASLALDNTSKLFNPASNTSTYGKFLAKDVKIMLSQGWKISNYDNDLISTFLTANMAASGETSIYVNNASDMPNGDTANTNLESNYFLITIEPNTPNEEKVLVKRKVSNNELEIMTRGFGNTDAVAHASGASVVFDTFEYTPLGTFYIEDISLGSSDMITNITLQDQFKFLNDKTLDYGFFRQDTTVPLAISDLLMTGNFPRKNIITLNRYSDEVVMNDGVLQFKFDDKSNNGANSNVAEGLNMRVYVLPTQSQDMIADMKLDAHDVQLSELDKALGILSYITPDFQTVKSTVNFSQYNLTSEATGDNIRNTYYQGVIDGYLLPRTTNASQTIGLGAINAGYRLYLDDQLIIDNWNAAFIIPSVFGYHSTLIADDFNYATISTVAGVPQKIRLEFFHHISTMSLRLVYSDWQTPIPSYEFLTGIVNDSIGSKGLVSNNALKSDLKNYGVPSTYVQFNNSSSMDWNINDGSIYISNSHANGNVLSYVRVPFDSSMSLSNSSIYTIGDWATEIIFKAPDGAYGGSGEYISSYSNANSTVGFEFFYISSTNHGIRLRPTSNVAGANITVVSSTAMPNGGDDWNHVIATYSKYYDKIDYYVNGELHASLDLNGEVPSFAGGSITIGGRGADYTSGVGPVLPTSSVNSSGINLYLDEFAIYKKYMTQEDAIKRYQETQIQEVKKFPFLYGFKESIYQAILNISFADLGRLYIDENNKAIYESYYAFFEPSIDKHANVQQTLSDDQYIINASLTKSLQVNSVIVKVSGISSKNNSYQSIWRAPDNSTLGVITLTSNISSNSNSIPASSFDLVPFPQSGYISIDDEIIKYDSINQSSFVSIQRGQLGSYPSSHLANAKIREVRLYDFEFDKTPAFSVKYPFITGILFEEPDEVKIINWQYTPYKANLIVSATDSVASNTVVFLEGVHPVTQEVAYTSIAGIPVQVMENNGQIKEQKAVDSENRRKYGLKEVTIESPFITDLGFAQKLADFIISKLADPIPILTSETVLTPKLQVGDRIRLSTLDQLDISNTDYWITSIDLSIGQSYSQNITLRKVV